MPIVPPSPMNCSRTPCHTMNSASVTTKDGMPIFDTRKPVMQPIAVPTQIASSISSQALAGTPIATISKPTSDNAAPAQIRW